MGSEGTDPIGFREGSTVVFSIDEQGYGVRVDTQGTCFTDVGHYVVEALPVCVKLRNHQSRYQ